FLRRSSRSGDNRPSWRGKQPGSAGETPATGSRALAGETPALPGGSPRIDAIPLQATDVALAPHFVYGWLLLLSSAALTLALSAPIWRSIPLIAYTQFPWRVLELSGLATALLAGLAVHLALRLIEGAGIDTSDRGRSRCRVAVVGLALFVLVVPSLVYLYPRQPFFTYGNLTPSDVTGWERNGGAVGTTSTGEYYPLDVRVRPTAPLPTDLAKVGRLDRATLPVGASVRYLGSSGYDERYRLTLPAAATLQFDVIRFAGWEVVVDGQTVASRASSGQGLLLADVPAGPHQVLLTFVDTPVRRLGWILALVSAVVLVLLGLLDLALGRVIQFWARPWLPSPPTLLPSVPLLQGEPSPSARERGLEGDISLESPLPRLGEGIDGEGALALDRRAVVTVGAGFVGLIALRAISPAPYAAIFARKSPLDRVFGVGHPALIRLEDRVEFLGYDLDDPLVAPGGSLAVTLYWRAVQPLTADYRSLAMIARVGDKGLLAQDDRPNAGGIPTHTWPTDRYFIDPHVIAVPTDAPPMVYQLQVALYDAKTLKHLQQDGVSGWQGEQIVLQRFHVTRPKPVDPSSYRSLPGPVFGGRIGVLGYQVNTDRPRAGQTLELTLIWRAEQAIDHDYTVFTHLIDAKQNQAAGNDSMPLNGQYPTSTWLAGEDVVDPHPIVLPTGLAPGQYHLAFGLYDAKTLRRLPVTEKDWNAPRGQIDLDALPIHVESAT
ncbi:MAG: hypothetical protein ACRDIY_23535, partial [Chloroflexota bacterium]